MAVGIKGTMYHQNGKEVVCIAGRFDTNGTGALTNVKGKGFSVARTDVGEYTVTLDKFYPELLSGGTCWILGSIQNRYPQIESEDMATRTVVLRGSGGTTQADTTSGTLCFHLFLRNQGQ